MAAVLERGEYVVRVWRATLGQDESWGPPLDGCSTEVTVEALDELRVEAALPGTGPCSFVAPTFETVFDP